MPHTEETMRLFDEKDRDDTTPSLRAESRYSFYDRSSLDGPELVRRMLERWLDRLPPAKRKDIVGRMRHKGSGSYKEDQSFDGAFFELFLREFLSGTGGDVVVDPEIGGRTPDFSVTETRPDGTQICYVVEATDINLERGTNLETSWIGDIKKPKERLYDKAKRYKGVNNLIIALRADPNLDRLDQILFGTLAYQVYYHKDPAATGPVPEPRHVQKRDGFWFNSGGPQNRNVIGVIAFHNLYPCCVDKATAVFYANPCAERPLPAWANEITHAAYDDGAVKIMNGKLPCAFVGDHEPFNESQFRFQ